MVKTANIKIARIALSNVRQPVLDREGVNEMYILPSVLFKITYYTLCRPP